MVYYIFYMIMKEEKEKVESIFVYDDSNQENVPPPLHIKPRNNRRAHYPKPQSQIYVFDDDEEEHHYQNQVVLGRKGTLDLNVKEAPPMTQYEYSQKCYQLQEKIILSNLNNFSKPMIKPQTTYFEQVKKQKRESEMTIERRRSGNGRADMLKKIEEVRVDFLKKNNKVSKLMINSITQDAIQESLRDQLEEAESIDYNQPGLKGAHLSKQQHLSIEEDKTKSLIKVSNFRQFLYKQLQPQYQINLLVKRTEKGFIDATYKFYFQQNSKFIMSCEKQGFSKYVFSTSEVYISEEHVSYLGKMETTFSGCEFWLYDGGEQCVDTKVMQNYKKQLAYIHYYQQSNRPRAFDAYITTCDDQSTDFTVLDKKNHNPIQTKWNHHYRKKLCMMSTKEPSYDPLDHSYKLDFRGLAGVPSIKNFILESDDFKDAMIFGKQDADTFLVRITAPLSLLQGAAICLSSIHSKFL